MQSSRRMVSPVAFGLRHTTRPLLCRGGRKLISFFAPSISRAHQSSEYSRRNLWISTGILRAFGRHTAVDGSFLQKSDDADEPLDCHASVPMHLADGIVSRPCRCEFGMVVSRRSAPALAALCGGRDNDAATRHKSVFCKHPGSAQKTLTSLSNYQPKQLNSGGLVMRRLEAPFATPKEQPQTSPSLELSGQGTPPEVIVGAQNSKELGPASDRTAGVLQHQ